MLDLARKQLPAPGDNRSKMFVANIYKIKEAQLTCKDVQCHIAVSAAGNTVANILRNIMEANATGLAVFGSSQVLVEENHISRNQTVGLSIGGSAKGEFKNNTISENEGPNVKVSASAAPLLFNNVIAAGHSQGLVFCDAWQIGSHPVVCPFLFFARGRR